MEIFFLGIPAPMAALLTVPQLPVSPRHLSPFPQTPLASHGPELHLCIQGVEMKVLPISHVTPTAPLVLPQWVPNTWTCHPSHPPGSLFTPVPCRVPSVSSSSPPSPLRPRQASQTLQPPPPSQKTSQGAGTLTSCFPHRDLIWIHMQPGGFPAPGCASSGPLPGLCRRLHLLSFCLCEQQRHRPPASCPRSERGGSLSRAAYPLCPLEAAPVGPHPTSCPP